MDFLQSDKLTRLAVAAFEDLFQWHGRLDKEQTRNEE
jgi:hypothetical protein